MPWRGNVNVFGGCFKVHLFKGSLLFATFLFVITNGQIVDGNSKENIEEDEVAHDEEDEEVEHEGAAKPRYSSVRLTPNIDDVVKKGEQRTWMPSYITTFQSSPVRIWKLIVQRESFHLSRNV